MFTSLVLIHLFGLCFSESSSFLAPFLAEGTDPDEDRSTVELIESRGFGAEVHEVITRDGYILNLHRIVNPRCKASRIHPVLLQHGVLSSSADWVINSPGGGIDEDSKNMTGNNLGFVLSKACYDVWMGNSRGNIYSIQHRLLTNSNDFWKFSFDEMAAYDQPAFIDYILSKTRHNTLSYIGHSQGSTQMFALLASNRTYSNVIKPFLALAPVTVLGHCQSILVRAAAEAKFLTTTFLRRPGQFVLSDDMIHKLAKLFCPEKMDLICLNIVFLLTGYDREMINSTRLQVYYQHTPAGTSNWAVLHFLQMVKSGNFAKMDFGKELNLIKYGSKYPPIYDLEMINNPDIGIMYGAGDLLSDLRDIDFLRKSLKVPLIEDYMVPFPKWNHVDFLYAKKLGELVNSRILEILARYRKA